VQEGRSTRFRDLSLDAFVARLGSPDPVPGGGSASAVAAALGASLVAMVASLSAGKARFAAHQATLETAQRVGTRLSDEFLRLAEEDAEAYAGYADALKLPRETVEEQTARRRAMSDAALAAAQAPLRCVESCLELVVTAEALAGRSNPNAASDLSVAALLGEAAARGAAANVLINAPSIADQEQAGGLIARAKELVDEIERLASTTRQVVQSGDSREPLPATGT
jgi:formiminotetrahydrofolate cyclodeaminase